MHQPPETEQQQGVCICVFVFSLSLIKVRTHQRWLICLLSCSVFSVTHLLSAAPLFGCLLLLTDWEVKAKGQSTCQSQLFFKQKKKQQQHLCSPQLQLFIPPEAPDWVLPTAVRQRLSPVPVTVCLLTLTGLLVNSSVCASNNLHNKTLSFSWELH